MPATFQCPDVLRDCECELFPVRNFSVETPDVAVFLASYNQPPTAGTWFAPGCLQECESTVSQEDADLCAQRAAFECSADNAPLYGNPLPSGRRFGNTLQTCDSDCPGGAGSVTSIVAPGTVVSSTQADANARAHGLACKRAETKRVCFATMSPLDAACVGQFMSVVFDLYGGTEPYDFILDAGSLPPGTELNSQGNLFGSPTLIGSYAFSILGTDSVGTQVVKAFTINVAQITTASPLPAGTQGAAYSQTIAQSGGVAPVTWAIVAGTLPAGLVLDPNTGVLSGTPTNNGVFTFTVEMTSA